MRCVSRMKPETAARLDQAGRNASVAWGRLMVCAMTDEASSPRNQGTNR